MTKFLTSTAAAACLFALAACGGGAGSGGGASPTPVSAPTKSSSTADMIAFAEDGGTSEAITATPSSTGPGPITRTTRSVTVDGKVTTVMTDATSEGVVGIVELTKDGVATYRFNDDAAIVTGAASGRYAGRTNATYRLDNGSSEVSGDGSFNLVLDTGTGEANYGLTVYADDGSSSVEAYGAAAYANGRFDETNDGVILRDENGTVIRTNEELTIDGAIIGSDAVNAAAGTIVGETGTGFMIDGVFMAGQAPK
ncbi:hypothetical protein GE300_14800 [Rhodobacteraceae bacterium 2CG4]|uniref:Transferrin-binding protein B C-lobe/N-lobe beta barrel domain-containing protein n=1 Tax=Halovulum marinum TaxID=2662447 RepID=A0A6L5Z455_9RHOB|nr:hypothetical protein [Halovulum marinum]MSU90870.1 hypothetical protein [Halovulum marinum]